LRSVIAQQILTLSDEHSLLPAQHIRAHLGRIIDTVLDFPAQQIHAKWRNKEGMAMLLPLKRTEAFDRIVAARLLHNMRWKIILKWIVKWVGSFISKAFMTLCPQWYNTKIVLINTGILPGSLLSLLFFLFYNANLVDTCNLPTLLSSETSFVDDINALAFGKTMEDNRSMLQSIYEHCLESARTHGASFALEKYILVHFA
jgi:hypothetical protein